MATFRLEHLVHHPGESQDWAPDSGTLHVFSPGLNKQHWDEFRRGAPLWVPPQEEFGGGALALYRAQSVDFVVAWSGSDASGRPMIRYFALSGDVLRALAGRVTILQDLATSPFEDKPGQTRPVDIVIPAEKSIDEQVEDVSDFLLALGDDFNVVEDLLASLVQGAPIAILNAPSDLAERLAFLQGFFFLLPAPARFGVTFSTFVRQPSTKPVQLAFLASKIVPQGYVCFDWQDGKLKGKQPPSDPYSRFIVQQLRLDPETAITQMQGLTRTAAWRLKRKQSLAKSLGWAAKRAALDAAVNEGFPADRKMVASVLRDDPTLSVELKGSYARHLLAFMLGLKTTEYVDLLASQVGASEEISVPIYGLLDDAIRDGKAYFVYRLVMTWLKHPDGPRGAGWRRRAHVSGMEHLKALVRTKNVQATQTFLEELRTSGEQVDFKLIVVDLINIVMPLVGESVRLAQVVFLLSAEYMIERDFQAVASNKDLVRHLSVPLQQAISHMKPGLPTSAPEGALAQASSEFGEKYNLIVLARLVEWANKLERPDLIDGPTLQRLVEIARSEWKDKYKAVLRRVVEVQSQSGQLMVLDRKGLNALVDLLILTGDYRQVVSLLTTISTTVFLGDEQANFAPWVSELFENTVVSTADLAVILPELSGLGMKPVPTAMAYRGALLNKSFDPELEPVMIQLAEALNTPRLLEMVGTDVAMRLLQHFARSRDDERAAALAAALTESAEGKESNLPLMEKVWKMLDWNDDVREAGTELLRRYVRRAPSGWAERVPGVLQRRLEPRIGSLMEATVTMSVLMGGHSMAEFARQVRIATDLLADFMAPYEEEPYPTLYRILSDLEGIQGTLADNERGKLSDDLLEVGRLAYTMGKTSVRKSKAEAHETALIAGGSIPVHGVDVMMWIGGFLAEGQAVMFNLERSALHHLIGTRSVNELQEDVTVTRELLEQMLRAFPPGDPPDLKLEAFRVEVMSLWNSLDYDAQDSLREDFSTFAQTLARLLVKLGTSGDDKALKDSWIGRNLESAEREPRSALEVIRLFSGYFGDKFLLR